MNNGRQKSSGDIGDSAVALPAEFFGVISYFATMGPAG